MAITIKAARINAELSQMEMAKALGMSRDTYRKIEKQPGRASIEQARKISEITGIALDDLFFAIQST